MGRAETRLKFFIEVIVFEMVLELSSNYFFQYFGEEWEIGNGPVVCKNFWVKGGFFEMWSDYGSFKGRWNIASLEGVVYCSGDQGTYGRDVCFHQGCRKGVEGTGGGFHLPDDVLNLWLRDDWETVKRLGDLKL